MAFLELFDKQAQRIRGVVAGRLGQSFDVRRLAPTTNVSILNQIPVVSPFYADLKRITSRDLIEGAVFDLLVFEALCDVTALHLGDVCTTTGYRSDGVPYVFAQSRPKDNAIWIRTDLTCSISEVFEPERTGVDTDAPGTGLVKRPLYAGQSTVPATQAPVVLVNGVYSLGAVGATPAVIPIGMQPLNRVRDVQDAEQPNIPPRTTAVMYVPPLGYELQEQSLVTLPSGDQYQLANVFEAQSGLVGTVAIVERVQARS